MDRYSAVFKLERIRPRMVADVLAELQVRWPSIPVVFCETRQLAEERTHGHQAAAHAWAASEPDTVVRITAGADETEAAPEVPEPGAAELPPWAHGAAMPVSDRGQIPSELRAACRASHARRP